MNRPRWTGNRVLALAVALIVIAGWFALAALTVFFIAWVWPSVVGLLISLVLVAVLVLSRPRFVARPEGIAVGAQAPALSGLIDDIATQLSATPPAEVFLNADANAATTRYGWRWRPVVVIGLPLATAITGQQFVALLAHEVAHDVNGDFGRGFLVGTAQRTLTSWTESLSPGSLEQASEDGISGLATWLLLTAVSLPVAALAALLHRASSTERQRAEFLADELAASVAGSEAAAGLLDRISFDASIFFAVRRAGREETDPWDGITGRFDELSEKERAAMRAEARREKWSVDSTHPPTFARIGRIRKRPHEPGSIRLTPTTWATITSELARFRPDLDDELRAAANRRR